MPRRRRSASQRYHDRVAGRYEDIYSDAYWQWHDSLTWDYIKPHLPRDLRAPTADLGCGAGKWGRKLLKTGYQVTFIDSSARMVDEARRQVEQTGSSDKAEFLQADLMDLAELPDEHLAFALAMGEPVGCTDDPARALREIHRCLSPGGILIATFDNRIACIDHYLEDKDCTELEKFLRTGRTHWLTRDKAERFEIHTFEPGQLHKLFAVSGFEVLETIGKTVLPMRSLRDQLKEAQCRRRWAVIEKKLARNPHNLARCAHLQITARKC